MLAEERRAKIQELLTQKPTVVIAELAEQFGTSEMTIRRDLDELEARGICQRIHGGAMSLRILEYQNLYPPFPAREQFQVREKSAIGRAAAAMVQRGELIAIDSGTTAAHMAYALRDHAPVTVLTNSLRVMEQLYDVLNITVISPGGTLSTEGVGAGISPGSGDLAFVGPITISTLRSFRPRKAFISTSGFSIPDGISNASLPQAEVKRMLIEIADEIILIADHTKFGRLSNFIFAPIERVHKVVTDIAAPQEEVEKLRKLGIEVILVEPAEEVMPLRVPVLPSV
ncbi:MAG: DeoR/GlpR transcriptional regulator [Chloroflexi bacterium]|nr:DeoR/GlpR transcriptional regulator [Chloroflexota bacterium]